MASCTKCGATLVTQARFCASCGSPVARNSAPPPIPVIRPNPDSETDPFARTMMGERLVEEAEAQAPPARSPMAASVMASPDEAPRPTPSPFTAPAQPPVQQQPARAPSRPPPLPAQAQQAPAQPQPPQAQPQPRPPTPQPAHYFVPGVMVLVYWADGNRYPGTVLQIAPQHVLVAFPNGMQQWVDVRYVTMGQ